MNSVVYLPTVSESNAWDFCLLMTGISENIPATFEYFRRFPEDLRMLPKMSEDVPMIS